MDNQKPEVFISYHTSSAKEIVLQIVSTLESAGIHCWYAPRNVVGDYASSIVDGIKNCKVFLLVLNEGADRSEDVRNEINCAFERFRRHEEIALLPFKVDACSLSDAVLYYLGRIHIMDGGLPPELLRLPELTDRIFHLLEKKQERTCYVINEAPASWNQPPEQKLYRIVGTTVTKDSSFVGRTRELEQMHCHMTEAPYKLILAGMGGIGKSQLVNAYCSQYRQDYDVTLWVSFDTNLQKTVCNDFTFPIQGLDRRDYPQDSDEDYFRRKLRVLNEIGDQRVLVIIDNFDVAEDPNLDDLARCNCSMLFTTRFHGLSGQIPEMEVTGMVDEKDLMALFSQEYKRSVQPGEIPAVKELLQILDGHPLSIRLFASAMSSNRITPSKMLTILQQGGQQHMTGKVADSIFGRLKKVFSLSAMTEEEMLVLKNLVLMPLTGVDVAEFYEWCQLDDFDVIDGLIRKSWVVHDEAADQVHLHPLIRDLMQEELAKDPDCCQNLLEALLALAKNTDNTSGQHKKNMYERIQAVITYLPADHPQKWEVTWSWARMLLEMSWYEEGISVMQQLREQTENLTDILHISQRIAQSYGLTGKPQDAIREAEIGMEYVKGRSFESLSQEQQAETLNLYTRQSEAYRSLGKYPLAEEAIRKVLDLIAQHPDSATESSLAWKKIFLARILSVKGGEKDLQEGDCLFRETEETFFRQEEKGAAGYANMFWAQLKMFQGAFDEAFTKHRKAESLLLPRLSPSHVDRAKLRAFEANIWRFQGMEDRAVQCYNEAVEMMLQSKNHTLAEKVRSIRDSGKVGYTN